MRGTLTVEEGTASGAITLTAVDAFALVRSPTGGIAFTLDVADGVLERIYANRTVVQAPNGDEARHQFEPATETLSLSGATARLALARSQAVALLAPADGGELRATPDGGLRIAAAGPTDLATADRIGVDRGDIVGYHRVDVAGDHVNATLAGGSLQADGPFTLVLLNMDVDLTQDGATRTFHAGASTTRAFGPVAEERVEKLVLHVESGRLDLRTLETYRLLAPTASVALEGAIDLLAADGELESGESTWLAAGDDVGLDGHARIVARPDASGERLALAVDGDVQPTGFALREPVKAILETPAGQAGAAGGGLLILGLAGAVAWRARRAHREGEGSPTEDAVLLLEQGHVAGALERFETALASDNRNAVLHLDRAQCLERLGRVAEARRAYETAVRLAPDSGEAHYHLARVLALSGLAPSAIAHLSQAASLDPAFLAAAREENAFARLRDHPTYRTLDAYYRRGGVAAT